MHPLNEKNNISKRSTKVEVSESSLEKNNIKIWKIEKVVLPLQSNQKDCLTK